MDRLVQAILVALAISATTLHATAAETTDQTKAEYNAAKARAKADYNASTQRCKDFSGNDRDVCMKKAKANLTKAKADAKAAFEGTGEAKLEAREDVSKAEFAVAKERCDSLAGDAKDVCVADAKAVYAKEEATLQAREKEMKADHTVAKERCSALTGEDRKTCLKDANIKFDN